MLETKDGKKDILEQLLGYQIDKIKDYRDKVRTYKADSQTKQRELEKSKDSKEKRKAMEEEEKSNNIGFNRIPPFNSSYRGGY